LDADVFEHEAQQLLAAVEVEGVDAVQRALGEVGDAQVQAVAGGELALAGGEGLVFLLQAVSADVDLVAASFHLGVVDHAGLVEVSDPPSFGAGVLESALQAGQLGAEQLVGGGWGVGCDRGLSGGDQVRAGEQLAYLVEDEGVQFVGAYAPFGAAVLGSAGAPGVAVRAEVVARRGVVAAGPVAVQLDLAVGAAQQPAQQERVGLGVSGTVAAVVPSGGRDGLQGGLVDDGRDRDLDPLLAGPRGGSGAA